MAATFYTMRVPMKRLLTALPVTVAALLVLAPAALAHDGGEGWWGETNDKIVTNAGFILIVFFPVFVFLMSMLQGHLEKRKDRRKKIHKKLAGEQDSWRGGW
jgi:heme/copper-type cytochrome/quinol oxidase subunit 2